MLMETSFSCFGRENSLGALCRNTLSLIWRLILSLTCDSNVSICFRWANCTAVVHGIWALVSNPQVLVGKEKVRNFCWWNPLIWVKNCVPLKMFRVEKPPRSSWSADRYCWRSHNPIRSNAVNRLRQVNFSDDVCCLEGSRSIITSRLGCICKSSSLWLVVQGLLSWHDEWL